MKISEETETKILLALVSNTSISGERIGLIINNIKQSKTIEEAEALTRLGVFFSRTIEPGHARKLGYWLADDLKKFKKIINDEDCRCKDDMFHLCSINCIWFRWCFICDRPICQLKDDWVDEDDFAHRDEYEAIFEKPTGVIN